MDIVETFDQIVPYPLRNNESDDDWQAEGDIAGSFDEDDGQRQRHPDHAAQHGRGSDQGKLAAVDLPTVTPVAHHAPHAHAEQPGIERKKES